MNPVKDLPPGKKVPEDLYVVVEIPMGSNVKYEIDEETGVVMVDRILFTAMFYPFNYGIVPKTLMPDGDPMDVLVVSHEPLMPGTVVRVRPVGVLEMEDEEGIDHKLIAVPVDKVDPTFSEVRDVNDLPKATLDRIRHFFEHYKELEPGKWTRVRGFHGVEEALRMVSEAVQRFGKEGQ